MLARVRTSTISGIEALPVEVEVQTQPGKPCFTIIGLADNAVKESRDRVIAALQHSGFTIPEQILVSLAPAELRKEGSAFDLPIAVGILAASGQIPTERLKDVSFHGELSLDGRLKHINGSIAYATLNAQLALPSIVLPAANAREAALVPSTRVIAARTLHETAAFLLGLLREESPEIPPSDKSVPAPPDTFSDVRGQESAKRALIIAAAGGHNALMLGPPGCGKSMLARRFSTLLPPLRKCEMLEVIRIHSIAGLDIEDFLRGIRPFRAPHYNVSTQGLVGGGSSPRPGEISLAHHGVLFLDEFPEFNRSALEALRLPLECGMMDVSRAKGTFRFPARFQLIAAMNPCPCGRLGVDGAQCLCSPASLQHYLKKLSQPILDRIDLHVELQRVSFEAIQQGTDQSPSPISPKESVHVTRSLQMERQGVLNALMPTRLVLENFRRGPEGSRRLLEKAHRKMSLSARGLVKVLKVGRTIADLETSEEVHERHIAEAISYRCLERTERLFK